ncbi:MAG: addiction module protein [Desulfococcaceae bacterium]|jgi:hypothetical protein|nr:addiction module protein [Desulfococcaceae bacterium]
MQLTSDQVYHEAMLLSNEAKIHLVEKLLENIGDNMEEDIEALQIIEAKKRRDDIRSGLIRPVPGEDALMQVRKMLEEK